MSTYQAGTTKMEQRPADVLDSHLELLSKKIGCDVTFVVGPEKQRIPCHKLFLISRSVVFGVMFEERWADTDVEVGATKCDHANFTRSDIQLPDVEPGIFLEFLQFVYADKLFLFSISQAENMLYLASKYEVLKLVEKCEDFLKSLLRINSVLELYSIADMYNLPFLKGLGRLMISNYFSELMADPSFTSMKANVLELFVSSTDTVILEPELFHGLIRWAEARCADLELKITGENLRTVLGDILFSIRFPLMTIKEFRNFVVPKNILNDFEKSSIYDYICLDDNVRSLCTCFGFDCTPRKKQLILKYNSYKFRKPTADT